MDALGTKVIAITKINFIFAWKKKIKEVNLKDQVGSRAHKKTTDSWYYLFCKGIIMLHAYETPGDKIQNIYDNFS